MPVPFEISTPGKPFTTIADFNLAPELVLHPAGLATPTAAGDAATKGYVDTSSVKVDGSSTLTSAWIVGNDLLNVGNVGIAAQKTLLLGTLTNAQENTLVATLSVGGSSPDKGKTWYNTSTNQIKYFDGSVAQIVGAAGSTLANLNGATGSTQTFATPGTSGTAPAWSTASNAHTLNIPLASASASVTAGLLSNTDYATFNAKQPAGNYLTALTGDVTATGPGSVAATLSATGVTAGTYAKVTVDAKGRAIAGSTLVAADLPGHSAALITSGALAVARGGTALTATPTNGQIPIGNGTDYTLATLTGGSGILVTNGAGSISIASTMSAANYVAVAGSTMTGALNLPADGLIAGSSQLVLYGGNVGIGTTAPNAPLSLGNTLGNLKLALYDGGSASSLYGLGIQANEFRFALGSTNAAYRFYNAPAGTALLTITSAGNVGIGSTAPAAALQITSGQVAGTYLAANSATINLSQGNVQSTDVAAGTLTFTPGSMLDGANYTIILNNTTGTGGTYTLSSADISTWKCMPTCSSNQITATAGKDTVMTILKAGTVAYVSWIQGF